MTEVPASERIALAIDTGDKRVADRLVGTAHDAGARVVKMGLELSAAEGWLYCARLAARYGLEWIADAKLHDIPNTVGGAVKGLSSLAHPPVAITMHTTAGMEAMQKAQEVAGASIKMLGVTVLTSISPEESWRIYNRPVGDEVRQLAQNAATAGLVGVVSSPQEVRSIRSDPVTEHLFTMVPGTRSVGANVNDQARTATPEQAITDGADLLVIGRQITQAENPAAAFATLIAEIEGAV